jgi:hypothetical protein
MNDCLITKLKTTVRDFNLEYLDGLKIRVKRGASFVLSLTPQNPKVTKIIQDGTYLFEKTKGQDIDYITSNSEYNVSSNSDYGVFDVVGLDLNYFSISGVVNTVDFQVINLEKFKNSKNITTLSLRNINSAGNVEFFGSFEYLKNIILSGQDVVGDIAIAFGHNNVSFIDIFNTSITGSLEALVAARRSKGISEGSITFGYIHPDKNKITFSGSVPNIDNSTPDENRKLQWTTSTITFNGITINA